MNFSLAASLLLFAISVNASPKPQETYDSLPQEQMFGAEIQYFRMRGGMEKNIPRARVIDLWTKALDAAKDAQMNTVTFYIPWDFHEYAEGKFDFDGTVDEDGDGHADYPSRDVKTFLQMIKDRGFTQVMARPGPYINAEWGFLGFGAIPQWFHEKYPDSHMRNAEGLMTKLYDYHSPDLHRHTQLWFKAVYENLLKGNLRPNGIIGFVQVDNETNFMWQSIYNHDFGPRATERYQTFLKNHYRSLVNVNRQHRRSWKQWSDIKPPNIYGQNVAEDQDWYRFQDHSIFTYLQKIRGYWEALGIHEPDVLFTLAESYNAAGQGLLPNYRLRNDSSTGLLTVNLYPKTDESARKPFLNQPFKADHDVRAQEAASEFYFGRGNAWVMGPEIQGGWWRGTPVTPEARQQTYLSVIGHGMKAMIVYYFNEGHNWGTHWQKEQVKPYFETLKLDPKYAGLATESLPQEFWTELQRIVDSNVMVGILAEAEMTVDPKALEELFFDAPLDVNANPRGHYFGLKDLGEKIYKPFGSWLRKSVSNTDPVCLIKDVSTHVPSRVKGIDSVRMSSEWEAGLVGYALNSGINLRFVHWGMNTIEDLRSCQVILHQDGGATDLALSRTLEKVAEEGRTVVNFLADSLAVQMGFAVPSKNISAAGNRTVTFDKSHGAFAVPQQPLFQYTSPANYGCKTVLSSKSSVHGYRCDLGKGTFIQVGALITDVFNSDDYSFLTDVPERTAFFARLIAHEKIGSSVRVSPKTPAAKVVAFSRRVEGNPETYITVKSGQLAATNFRLQVSTVDPQVTYTITDALSGSTQTLTGETLLNEGFEASLNALGSTVFWIEPAE